MAAHTAAYLKFYNIITLTGMTTFGQPRVYKSLKNLKLNFIFINYNKKLGDK